MTNKKITIDKVLSFPLCSGYTRERLLEISSGREEMTAFEICNLESVSAEDKLWLLLRPYFFSKQNLLRLSAEFAESVLPLFERVYPSDERPRLAIQANRDFADEKINFKTLEAARCAALDAAVAAYWYDPENAAVESARTTAAFFIWDAAFAAANANARNEAKNWTTSTNQDTVWCALRIAAIKSARIAEREKQLNIVKKYIEKGDQNDK